MDTQRSIANWNISFIYWRVFQNISNITHKFIYKNNFYYYLHMVHCRNKCKFHDPFDYFD